MQEVLAVADRSAALSNNRFSPGCWFLGSSEMENGSYIPDPLYRTDHTFLFIFSLKRNGMAEVLGIISVVVVSLTHVLPAVCAGLRNALTEGNFCWGE